MCSLFICFVLQVFIPQKDGKYFKSSYSFDTVEECQALSKIYVEYLQETEYDVDKLGNAYMMCAKVMTI